MPFEKSAGAIIFYRCPDGKIEYLILQHNNNYWNFPKGRMEKGERETDTVRREVQEETGLKKIEIMPSFRTWEKYFYRGAKDSREVKKRGKVIFKIATFYLAETKEKNVKISSEHTGYI